MTAHSVKVYCAVWSTANGDWGFVIFLPELRDLINLRTDREAFVEKCKSFGILSEYNATSLIQVINNTMSGEEDKFCPIISQLLLNDSYAGKTISGRCYCFSTISADDAWFKCRQSR